MRSDARCRDSERNARQFSDETPVAADRKGNAMPHAVAVDIGGTFTDLVAYDRDSGAVLYTKSPTTYGNLVDGVLDCFLKAKLEPKAASLVNHGTTLVINALIQRRGAKAALVTTAGFR